MKRGLIVLVIDDELLARKRVANLLNEVQEVDTIHECSSGNEAIFKINDVNPDIVFLDIQLIDLNGFEVLQKVEIKKRFITIFITAYDEFALKAFDYFAFDYLLKPFKDERFFQSIKRAIEMINTSQVTGFTENINKLIKYLESPSLPSHDFNSYKLAIKSNGKISFIDKDAIKYIMVTGNYAEIYTDQKKYLLREPLNVLIDQLNPSKFIRIHRSAIINVSYMKEVIYSNYSEVDVKMSDEKLFRISKTYKKDFQKKLGV